MKKNVHTTIYLPEQKKARIDALATAGGQTNGRIIEGLLDRLSPGDEAQFLASLPKAPAHVAYTALGGRSRGNPKPPPATRVGPRAMTCSKCNEPGHNQRSCKKPRVSKGF